MVIAGFGWSAGDIATAANLIIKVSKAFKAADGAAIKYENDVGFLQSLKATLDHLARLGRTNSTDECSKDIAEQLDRITPHWKRFEAFLQKFDRSLSQSSTRSKLAKTPRTIQYTLKELSGETDKLRVAVTQPLQVINTLLSIQVVEETRLVPRKLLTPDQCLQLVEAVRLAGVPVALEHRLERLESMQTSKLDDATTSLSKKIDCITNEVKGLTPLTSQACSYIPNRQSTDPRPIPAVDSNDANLRLLVEDQHWAVIQLLRSLSQQLEEARNGNLLLCDVHSQHPRGYAAKPTSAVAKSAAVLGTAMASSTVTGIVVGKTVATAATAAGHASLSDAASISAPLDSASRTSLESLSARMTTRSVVDSPDTNLMAAQDVTVTQAIGGTGGQGNDAQPVPELSERTIKEPVQRADSVISRSSSPVANNEECWTLDEERDSACHDSGEIPASQDAEQIAGPTSAMTFRSRNNPVAMTQNFRPDFFRPGRVFATLWTAAAESASQTSRHVHELPYIDTSVVDRSDTANLRRFVVLREEGQYSLCAPIYQLDGPGVMEQQHRQPYEMPIRMESDEGDARRDVLDLSFKVSRARVREGLTIRESSVLKLSEIYMIEHSVTLVEIGLIDDEELPLLDQLWRDANTSACRSWLLEDDANGLGI